MTSDLQLPLSFRLDHALRAELGAGERIIWSGRPDPKRMFFVMWAWLFAIPWTLFALAWDGIAWTVFFSGTLSQADDFSYWVIIMPIFGLPFIAVGVWMMWQPIARLSEAAQQIHALTNQRIMTLTLRGNKQLKSVNLATMGPISRKEKRDGWGNLKIETGSHRDSEGDRVTDLFELVGIPEVAKLERLLREAQQTR